MLVFLKTTIRILEILPFIPDTTVKVMQILQVVQVRNIHTHPILILIILGVFAEHGEQVQQRSLSAHQIVGWWEKLVRVG